MNCAHSKMHIHPRLKISQRRHPTTPILANKIDEPALALPWPHLLKTNSSWRIGAELRLSFATCSAGHCSGTLRPRRLPSFTVSEKREDGSRVFTRTRLAARWWTRPGPHVELARAAFLLVLFTRPVNLLASRLASRGVRATPAMRCATPSHLVSIARVSRVSIYGRAPIPSCSSNKPSSSSFYRSIHF